MDKLKGKVALVTGSGRGLGRSYALRLAGLGADVVINDVNLESAKQYNEELSAATVMDEIRAMGCRSLGIEADLAKKAEVEALFAQILDAFGRVDILVNNAGGGLRPPGEHSADELFDFTMEINLMSAVYCCQVASAPMKRQGSGKIVNISSLAGLTGRGGGAPYSIAKAGIAHYTRVLAAELGPHGVNVNCIAPGYVETHMTNKLTDEVKSSLNEQIPLGRIGNVKDIAYAVAFLASDEASYITGQTLSVDGGMVM